ncbi:pentapeptide repeat-containing protein [Actinoplanes sp. N902-109]|uniref:pentapeptide repeat-containing protein n=1 Tax=Actinoplanes sp. (strain N902-109) TaxID=649831 RepID=UPI0003A36346|nr:pentapeptide repeat-containing protein [Actinoplanes sp. N902-109]
MRWRILLGLTFVVAALALGLHPWAWPLWPATGRFLAAHWLALTLAGLGVVTLGRPAWRLPRVNGTWLLSYRGVATVAGVVAATGVIAMVAMLSVAAGSPVPGDRAKLQIDAIKYGLGSFAAAGAAAALLLGVRRQQHTEQAQIHTEHDATERRVTDLYTKAVEQLGSADAAVRLGGLYALERVAQNTAAQRQTVVNVVCAYLRMPYTPPADPPPLPAGDERDPRQELQVRLTAQRILSAHLSPGFADAFWPGIDLDLTGATLVDWALTHAEVGRVTCNRAVFHGTATFEGTAFAADATFTGATFLNHVKFREATFAGRALLDRVRVDGRSTFSQVSFCGEVWFDSATLARDAYFQQTRFVADADFSNTTFRANASFINATFSGNSTFVGSTFTEHAAFDRATFASSADFTRAEFGRTARFHQVTFAETTRFEHSTFRGNAHFSAITGQLMLDGARAEFRADRTDEWPAGWALGDEKDGYAPLRPSAGDAA